MTNVRFEAQWMESDIMPDGIEDFDPALCEYGFAYFKTKDEAEQYALAQTERTGYSWYVVTEQHERFIERYKGVNLTDWDDVTSWYDGSPEAVHHA